MAQPKRNDRAESVVAELSDPVLVEPEVVRELVQHGDADFVLELARILEVLLEHEIRVTVLHELAHYFGFDEDRIGELGYD